MTALFAGFHAHVAHLASPTILPKLKKLIYNGDGFHWFLAKSPTLQWLELTRPCYIHLDAAPNETNHTLYAMVLTNRSSILNPSASHYGSVQAFLAHFKAVKHVKWMIYDHAFDFMHALDTNHDLNEHQEGSYAVFLRLLKAFAATVTFIDLGLDLSTDERSVVYLHHVLPCEGFKDFSSL